jgi:hypothetical protein
LRVYVNEHRNIILFSLKYNSFIYDLRSLNFHRLLYDYNICVCGVGVYNLIWKLLTNICKLHHVWVGDFLFSFFIPFWGMLCVWLQRYFFLGKYLSFILLRIYLLIYFNLICFFVYFFFSFKYYAMLYYIFLIKSLLLKY